jgi:hypothetical protein
MNYSDSETMIIEKGYTEDEILFILLNLPGEEYSGKVNHNKQCSE